jgi:putative Mg2+ transporter-C (MgtC) family protein
VPLIVLPPDAAEQIALAARALEAAALGAIIGWQREHVGRPAGMRTFASVAAGACVFGIISAHFGDTGRIASQVIPGIGFLGAGIILKEEGKVIGLTTAASLWATASIGLTVAYGLHVLGLLVAVLLLGLLALPLHRWEHRNRGEGGPPPKGFLKY